MKLLDTTPTASDSFIPDDPSAAAALNGTLPLAQPGAGIAGDILDYAPAGALTVVDEHGLHELGLDAGHVGLGLVDEAHDRSQHLAWVDLGGPGTGEWLAQNFGGPSLTYMADDDPQFDEASRYAPDAVADELDAFGTPSLPAAASRINRLNNLTPISVIVLSDAWAARPYDRIRRRVHDTASASIRESVIAQVNAWQSADFAEFARLFPEAATLVFASSEDDDWQFWASGAAAVFPRSS